MENLSVLEDERHIAQELADEFYRYGLSLQKKNVVGESAQPLETTTLSEEDRRRLDEWFLGKKAYSKRTARLGENPPPAQFGEMRTRLLQVYFKALARPGESLERCGKK